MEVSEVSISIALVSVIFLIYMNVYYQINCGDFVTKN